MSIMIRYTVYLEAEQLAKLVAISENSGSVALPTSNQIRGALDDYIKARLRLTKGWEKHMKQPRVGGARIS